MDHNSDLLDRIREGLRNSELVAKRNELAGHTEVDEDGNVIFINSVDPDNYDPLLVLAEKSVAGNLDEQLPAAKALAEFIYSKKQSVDVQGEIALSAQARIEKTNQFLLAVTELPEGVLEKLTPLLEDKSADDESQ